MRFVYCNKTEHHLANVLGLLMFMVLVVLPALGQAGENQATSFQLWHTTFSTSHAGTLELSSNRVSWEETGQNAHRSDNFEASCSGVKDAGRRLHTINNVMVARATFYIRLQNRKYDFWAGSEDNMVTILRAISRTCPQIPGPGK